MAKIRLLLNAVPLTNVHTGISRYLVNLYTQLAARHGDRLDIRYFDGVKAARSMPCGPTEPGNWSRMADLFWKLPPRPAAGVRIGLQTLRQHRFMKAAQGMDVYHEAAFFPFVPPESTGTVFTVHDMSLERHPEWHPGERVLFNNFYFRRRLAFVDHFITVSDFTKQEFTSLTGIDPNRTTTTPLAHASGIFTPQTADRIRETRKRYNIPERYFLFVGGGDPRKNLQVVPPALELGVPEAALVVVSWSGWATNKSVPKNVIMTGHVSDTDLAALYSGARALIFPSEYEGFGLPILEAMACGCPVITADRASLPEVAGDAAVILNDPRDTSAMAEASARVDSDQDFRDRLRRKGRQRTCDFSWQRTADATFEIFEKVAGS